MPELSQLVAGDKVILKESNGHRVLKVEKVTKNHIIVEGTKYRKHSGSKVGSDSWTFTSIDLYDEAVWAAIKQHSLDKKMIHRLDDMKWNEVPVEILPQIWELLPPEVKL